MTQRPTVLETIIGLFEALELRETCEDCEGRGLQYFEHQGGVTPEPCECAEAANEALVRYRYRYASANNIKSHLDSK